MRHRIFCERERFFCYVQWIADEQWHELRKFAEERGVALMGDIPFGVSYYSADVFSEREIFHLDWSGARRQSRYFKDDAVHDEVGTKLGASRFTTGQRLRAQDFAWWRQRVRGVKRIFHIFRIDHVLGFIGSTPFRGDQLETQEFLPLDCNAQMLAKTGGQWPHFTPRDDENAENAEAESPRRRGIFADGAC